MLIICVRKCILTRMKEGPGRQIYFLNRTAVNDVTSTTPRAGPGVLPLLLFWACGSTPRSTIPDLREYSPRVLPVYDFKGFGSTPRSAIPDLREYSHKSGIVPLGVLPDPLKSYTGSTLGEYSRKSGIVLLGVLPQA